MIITPAVMILVETARSNPPRSPEMIMSKIMQFHPVGFDLFTPTANAPERYTYVKIIKAPAGCPPNGTAGHVWIKPVHATSGYLINSAPAALVLARSLVPASGS